MTDTAPEREVQQLDRIVVRFAGDSGDGMQLTGERFTSASALFGNDLATLPEFPAEIRAPQGTLAGVSAFQVQVSDHDITTPGDSPNVLIAMNPAALKNELHRLEIGGTIIVNTDTFEERNLSKAGYDYNPLESNDLDNYTVFEVPMTSITKEVCKGSRASSPGTPNARRTSLRLGLLSWLYHRPLEPTIEWIDAKFGQAAARRRGEQRSVQGRTRVRRDRRDVRLHLRGQAGQARAGDLHQRQWQHRAVVGSRRRWATGQAADVLG